MSTIFDRKGQIMTTKTNVLLLYPELAAEIGVNEAIILAQLHYWIEKNKENHVNFRDGRTWVFQTYKEWREQFPFWGKNTIIRAFERLEKCGLIISANYNKHRYDQTKWYTINYDKAHEVLSHNGNMDNPLWVNGDTQNGEMFDTDTGKPIQENNKYNNKRVYSLL